MNGFQQPADDVLNARLSALGWKGPDRVRTHTNRTVMVSLSPKGQLRVHRGYAYASDRVLRAILRFLAPRATRTARAAARRELLAFPVELHAPGPTRAKRRARPHPGDAGRLERLRQLHARLNARFFNGELTALPLRLSTRMRRRLGDITLDRQTGRAVEISISRRHLRAHGWAEVEQTLLHEMVHQWQAERGYPVDHGRRFRAKARDVGIVPTADRFVGGEHIVRQ